MTQTISPMLKRVWRGSKRPAAAYCVLTVDGKRRQVTLGQWGSKDALEAYKRLTSEATISDNNGGAVTIATLCARFYADAQARAADPSSKFDSRELRHYATVIKYLVTLYGSTLANRFSASNYREFRTYLVSIAPNVESVPDGVYSDNKDNRARGIVGQSKYRVTKRAWTSNYITQLMRYLRMIFSWGVGHDLIDPATAERFKHVERLRCNAPAKQPRLDVPDDIVKATLPYLTPTVRDMVIIQRQNALRPNEVCGLRVGDIDRSGEVWSVRKITKTCVPMIIVFCESDREIIARHIAGKSDDDYLFTPAESMQERWQERAAQRKSKVTPSQLVRAETAAENKLGAFRQCYTVDAYRNAIYYAIRRANADGVTIPKWTPYQLRHTAVTETSYQYGIDAARAMAGHTTINMTAHYEHTAERLKADLASKRAAYFDS